MTRGNLVIAVSWFVIGYIVGRMREAYLLYQIQKENEEEDEREMQKMRTGQR